MKRDWFFLAGAQVALLNELAACPPDIEITKLTVWCFEQLFHLSDEGAVSWIMVVQGLLFVRAQALAKPLLKPLEMLLIHPSQVVLRLVFTTFWFWLFLIRTKGTKLFNLL